MRCPKWGSVVLMGLGKVRYSTTRSRQYCESRPRNALFRQNSGRPGSSKVTHLRAPGAPAALFR